MTQDPDANAQESPMGNRRNADPAGSRPIRPLLLIAALALAFAGGGGGPARSPSPTPPGQVGPGEPDESGIPRPPSGGAVR